MKKIITGMLVSLLLLSGITSSVSAYQISEKKENIITTSLTPEITTKIENIVGKWDEAKTYSVYKKIKKLVFQLQIKTLNRTDISETEKESTINKYNAVLYIIEKNVADKYMPTSGTNDSI